MNKNKQLLRQYRQLTKQVAKEYAKITKPLITYHPEPSIPDDIFYKTIGWIENSSPNPNAIPDLIDRLLAEDKVKWEHMLRIVLPYSPKLIGLLWLDDKTAPNPSALAQLLKDSINERFANAQQLEALGKRPLIKFSIWLLKIWDRIYLKRF